MFNENKPQIYIAALYRNNRHSPLDAKFHGLILVRPKKYMPSNRQECSLFDVTDAMIQYEDGTVDPNVGGEWRFRARHGMDVLAEARFVGGVMVGKVPRGRSVGDLGDILGEVEVPVTGRTPRENCWSWVAEGVERLQREGWVVDGDVGGWVQRVKEVGEGVIEKGRPGDWRETFVDGRGVK